MDSAQTLFNRMQFTDLISCFPPHIRTQLHNKTEIRTVKAGEFIFKRGEEGPWFARILAGRVRLCIRASESKELLLSTVERGEIFGERAFFDGNQRASDAIAVEDTTFTIFTRDEFFPLFLQHPEVMFTVIQFLCRRINAYISTMELYALHDLPTRVAQVLLFLGQKFGRDVKGRLVVRTGLNQSDLGQLVGSSRESVNKQLKLFCNKGYIAIEGNTLILLDTDQLQKLTIPIEIAPENWNEDMSAPNL